MKIKAFKLGSRVNINFPNNKDVLIIDRILIHRDKGLEYGVMDMKGDIGWFREKQLKSNSDHNYFSIEI